MQQLRDASSCCKSGTLKGFTQPVLQALNIRIQAGYIDRVHLHVHCMHTSGTFKCPFVRTKQSRRIRLVVNCSSQYVVGECCLHAAQKGINQSRSCTQSGSPRSKSASEDLNMYTIYLIRSNIQALNTKTHNPCSRHMLHECTHIPENTTRMLLISKQLFDLF